MYHPALPYALTNEIKKALPCVPQLTLSFSMDSFADYFPDEFNLLSFMIPTFKADVFK